MTTPTTPAPCPGCQRPGDLSDEEVRRVLASCVVTPNLSTAGGAPWHVVEWRRCGAEYRNPGMCGPCALRIGHDGNHVCGNEPPEDAIHRVLGCCWWTDDDCVEDGADPDDMPPWPVPCWTTTAEEAERWMAGGGRTRCPAVAPGSECQCVLSPGHDGRHMCDGHECCYLDDAERSRPPETWDDVANRELRRMYQEGPQSWAPPARDQVRISLVDFAERAGARLQPYQRAVLTALDDRHDEPSPPPPAGDRGDGPAPLYLRDPPDLGMIQFNSGDRWHTRIHPDGRVEFAPGVDPGDEGRRFWAALSGAVRESRQPVTVDEAMQVMWPLAADAFMVWAQSLARWTPPAPPPATLWDAAVAWWRSRRSRWLASEEERVAAIRAAEASAASRARAPEVAAVNRALVSGSLGLTTGGLPIDGD